MTGMLLPFLAAYSRGHWELPKKELKMLDQRIADSKKYDHEMQVRIKTMTNNLKDAVKNGNQQKRFDLSMALSKIYRPINTDSSYKYSVQARYIAESLADAEKVVLARLAVISALSTEGLFSAVIPVYDSIGKLNLSRDLKTKYWMTGRQLFSYMRSYAEGNESYHDYYTDRYNACDDSLLKYGDKSNNFYKFISAERLVEQNKPDQAKRILEPLLEKLPTNDNLYGMAAFQLAEVYKQQGDQTKYAAYLAKSAASDIEGCVKEGISLAVLSDWLYEQGELNDAFRYVNYALEDARTGNARMRAVMIASLVPHIDEAYRERISNSRDEMMIYVVLVTILFAATLALLFINRRQSKKTRESQRMLSEMSQIQNTYIGSFIGMCSSYSERLDSLVKLVNRKLSAGQHAELLKIIKSGKYSEGGDENFYEYVDKAFLRLFPGFVDSINTLLREEERIEIKDPYTLTPELRIYAFVKLGVTESTKIAQILQYSVNTVYAYRNKMRNKAIDRDNFDENVINIGV